MDQHLVTFAIILLIILALGINLHVLLVALIVIIILGYFFNIPENLVSIPFFNQYLKKSEPIEISDQANDSIGDISIMNNIDHNQQEVPIRGVDPGKIDNSDIVDMAINRNNTIFKPNDMGISMLSSQIAKTKEKYSTPINGRQSIDEVMARKQQDRGSKNKKAIEGHVQATKDLYQKYFTEELEENEGRVWWSSESANIETDFSQY